MLSENINNIISVVSADLTKPLTELLHKLASDSGWPADVIQVMKVSHSDDGTLYVDYPDEYAEEIGNLEYGDINGLPNAVIRPFIARAPSIINPAYASVFANELVDAMEVL